MSTARDRPPEEAAEDTSFARGLRVLLTIADRGEIRADELSTLLDTPSSTIYRYLRTLTEFGFVDRSGAGYRLGPRLVIGRGTNVSSEELIRLADPILRSLAVGDGRDRRRQPPDRPVGGLPARGAVAAVAAGQPGTGPGDAARRRSDLEGPSRLRSERYRRRSVRPGRRAFRSAIGARSSTRNCPPSQAAGIARSEGEPIPGAVTISVPIMREDGIVAAISIIGPGDALRTRLAGSGEPAPARRCRRDRRCPWAGCAGRVRADPRIAALVPLAI